MKVKLLLIAALLSPTLTCEAQDQPSPPPAAPSSTQAASPAGAAAPGATPAPLAAGKLADTYVIGATDQIEVSVWKEPAVSGSLLVRPDGMITMALLGDVQAAGMTPLDLGAQITVRLRKFLQDPVVNVVVVAIHSKNIYAMGEVLKKGPIELTPGMTLLQAMAQAQLTEYANVKKAYILRDEGGKRLRIPIHYKEALKGNPVYDLVLKVGDTIVVP